LKLRMATTESYVDNSNARKERTEWHRVTIWGKRGEGLAKILHKGDRLFVEGRIQTSSYDKDGEKRYSTEVVATNVLLCGGGGRGETAERPAAREAAPIGGAHSHDPSDDIPF